MKVEYLIGEYNFLNNFYISDIEYEGVVYPSVENAFQAAKVLRDTPKGTNAERIRIGFARCTPSMSKFKGGKVEVREDWEQIKEKVMYGILKSKFRKDSELGKKLVATGNLILIEGNNQHDNYWGNCDCEKCRDIVGVNVLGKMLMEIRKEIS